MKRLTVIAAFFNMQRKAVRTLYTLTDEYQQDVSADDYDVVVMDNGSSAPLNGDMVRELGTNFTYHFVETTSKSPVAAISTAVRAATTPHVLCMIDGARMLTPQILARALEEAARGDDSLIDALSPHLGSQLPNDGAFNGYTQKAEDELLSSVAGSRADTSRLAFRTFVWFLNGSCYPRLRVPAS